MGGVNSSFHYCDVKASCSVECTGKDAFLMLNGKFTMN